MILRMDQTAAD